MKAMEHIYHSIDWLSIKLTGVAIPFLFITGSDVLRLLGYAVMLSTLIYNGIRIYKELKNKNK
jgi:hypothetical protein